MSRVFSKVSPQLWGSDRFRGLEDDSAKLLYLYLLTSEHQNSIGCYRLPAAYACDDIGWDPPQYYEALPALLAADLVEVDEQTREIRVLRWFKHNPPTNIKHAQGAFRLADNIESETLRAHAKDELTQAWEKWQAEHPGAGGGAGHSGHAFDTPRMRAMAGRG